MLSGSLIDEKYLTLNTNTFLMKNNLLLIVLLSCSIIHAQKVVHSTRSNIKVILNGKTIDWRISPEVNPDRLKVYCSREKNVVVFQSYIDSCTFVVSKNDTIKFNIILGGKDTARTEIIGIKELPNSISNTDKLYWLSQLWSEVKYNFVNIDKFKYDLDSIYKSLIPSVLATKNDFEYYQHLKKFMAALHDGHTEISDNSQFYPFTDYIPLVFQDFNKRVYICSVRKIPELDSSWLGAELIEIENIPTSHYLETKIFPYISASTEQHLWMQGVRKLHSDFKNGTFKGTIKKLNGKVVNIELKHNGEETRTDNDQYWEPAFNYSRKIVELKWLNNGIAMVSFNQFAPEDNAIQEFEKIVNDLYKAKGVIIDLRKNGGGSTIVANHLQKYLTKEKYFLNFSWETRVNDGVRKANGNWVEEYKDFFLNRAYRFIKADTVFIPDSLKRLNCPTAILIGRFTFSAAEDFLVNIFEVPGRPKLIGEETGGSTGSPLVIQGLPGGGYARICTRRICYPLSGKRFVNQGVKPDIEVKQTINDFLVGKDVVLERAVKEINTSVH